MKHYYSKHLAGVLETSNMCFNVWTQLIRELTRILLRRFMATGFSAVHSPTRWRLNCLTQKQNLFYQLRHVYVKLNAFSVWVRRRKKALMNEGNSNNYIKVCMFSVRINLLVSIRWSALMVNRDVCRCLGKAPSLKASSCIFVAISLSPSWI